MKFIQDIHGDFVRTDKIVMLEVTDMPAWTVYAHLNEYRTALKKFNTEAEARSWLKELVIQIEDELSGRNVTRAVFKDVTQLIKGMRHADSD